MFNAALGSQISNVVLLRQQLYPKYQLSCRADNNFIRHTQKRGSELQPLPPLTVYHIRAVKSHQHRHCTRYV